MQKSVLVYERWVMQKDEGKFKRREGLRWELFCGDDEWVRVEEDGVRVVFLQNVGSAEFECVRWELGTLKRVLSLLQSVSPTPRREVWRLGVVGAWVIVRWGTRLDIAWHV
ncbi:hypothetical protein PIB30_101314 [Stylosanthes scabra]|uniref:Uncharacterized protein n=1 Tax=Stylosanthes scabra TaxID=79078 RepID=A0ABU6QWT9_9FABA|nr:hypothetical protein [Stylosanthes scabra]